MLINTHPHFLHRIHLRIFGIRHTEDHKEMWSEPVYNLITCTPFPPTPILLLLLLVAAAAVVVVVIVVVQSLLLLLLSSKYRHLVLERNCPHLFH